MSGANESCFQFKMHYIYACVKPKFSHNMAMKHDMGNSFSSLLVYLANRILGNNNVVKISSSKQAVMGAKPKKFFYLLRVFSFQIQ